MKLGFITACLPDLSMDEVVAWASTSGYDSLEMAAWPKLGNRPFTATHLDADDVVANGPDAVLRSLETHGVGVCSVSYYDNNLHPDPQERQSVNDHVASCIEAAALVGSPTVGTFVGRDWTKSVKDNLAEAEEIFKPLVDLAGQRGVKLVIENCVMEGWHPDGYPGNLAYSPELWEWMFEQGLYLNFDPSHLMWMGIEPISAYVKYADHVPLAQAKDIQLFPEQRNQYGWAGKSFTRQDPWDVGWWRYRVPGLGQVDWPKLVDAMYEAGYDGVLSVEHEDPVWGGTEAKIKTGLEIARDTLRPLLHG